MYTLTFITFDVVFMLRRDNINAGELVRTRGLIEEFGKISSLFIHGSAFQQHIIASLDELSYDATINGVRSGA